MVVGSRWIVLTVNSVREVDLYGMSLVGDLTGVNLVSLKGWSCTSSLRSLTYLPSIWNPFRTPEVCLSQSTILRASSLL